ncbi:major facilitator superfamily domain-containing protein [Gongronella butleri]|nr:major facilitator superfamily domain-containing protein [Gongronella butleri]
MSADKNSRELPLQPESNATAPTSYQSITPANDIEDVPQKNQIDPVVEKRLLRKIDLRIVPWVAILYLLLSLDRNNIGNARLGTLEKDLNLVGNDYYTALTIFFAGYVIFMIPSNLMLKWVKPSRWIASTMILWGVSSLCQAFTHNAAGLIACRFFLGAFENGVGPATPLYLSFWYLREELALRIAIYFGASTIAGAFAGAIGYGVLRNLEGAHGIAGWRWLFIVEAIPTIVFGFLTYFALPNLPSSKNKIWLTPEERQVAIDRIEQGGNNDTKPFDKKQFTTAFLDYRLWLAVLIYIGLNVCLASFAVFLPTIIKDLGFTSLTANLLTIPPYVIACIVVFIISWNSDRTLQRGYHIMGVTSIGVLGYIFLLVSQNVPLSYVGAILAATGIYPNIALVQAWVANNCLGHTKRATSLAIVSMVAQCFAILGTQIYPATDAPRYRKGHGVCLAFMVLAFGSAAVLRFMLNRENKKRDNEHGKPTVTHLSTLKDFDTLYEQHPQFRYAL